MRKVWSGVAGDDVASALNARCTMARAIGAPCETGMQSAGLQGRGLLPPAAAAAALPCTLLQ